MTAGRILLAEDNANDVELTLAALAQHNLANQVDVVRDGTEVLDYLLRQGAHAARAAGDPVLILLDLKMPKMDGFDVLRRIKSDAALKQIPVVALTSSRDGPDVRQCYELGVNAYVAKPVKFEEFARAVSQLGLFWMVLNQVPPPKG